MRHAELHVPRVRGSATSVRRAPTKPEVEVSSSFPLEMLLGRLDRVQVSSGPDEPAGRLLLRRPRRSEGRERLVAEPSGGKEPQDRDPKPLPERHGASGANQPEPGVPGLPWPGAPVTPGTISTRGSEARLPPATGRTNFYEDLTRISPFGVRAGLVASVSCFCRRPEDSLLAVQQQQGFGRLRHGRRRSRPH